MQYKDYLNSIKNNFLLKRTICAMKGFHVLSAKLELLFLRVWPQGRSRRGRGIFTVTSESVGLNQLRSEHVEAASVTVSKGMQSGIAPC